MDQVKPFSYLSLKCVFQHLDVNKRFFIASHLPPLRKIHKAAPLKIETLKLGKSSFTINGTKYSFTTIIEKDSDKKRTLTMCRTWTNRVEGGVPYDVDHFGNEDMDEVLVSGDILIEEKRELHLEDRRQQLEQRNRFRQNRENLLKAIEEERRCMENVLEKLEDVVKVLNKELPIVEKDQEDTKLIHQLTKQQLGLEENEQARQKFEMEIEQLQNELDENQQRIQYIHRNIKKNERAQKKKRKEIEDNQLGLKKIRYDLKPPKTYTQYILTNDRTKLQRSLRFPYGIKIRDALKQQLQHVLGGRRGIQVNRLEIDISSGILRLPEGMKIEVKDLSIGENPDAIIEAIGPILDVSSFPLECLSLEVGCPRDPLFQNEIVRSAKSLDIKILNSIVEDSLSDVIINLPNPRIHFPRQEFSLENIMAITCHWIKSSRSVGSKFSMTSGSVLYYLDYLVVEIPEAIKNYSKSLYDEFPYCVTIQISSTSELMIYGFETPNHSEELAKEYGKPWMLVMEVMTIGSAKQN